MAVDLAVKFVFRYANHYGKMTLLATATEKENRYVEVPLRLENYLPLIAKIVRSYHRSLPEGKKSWIDLEDMIHDVVVVVKSDLMSHYDPRKARFTTLLTISVERFCMNYLKSHRRLKRDQGFTVPLEDVSYLKARTEPTWLDGDVSRELLATVYRRATPLLQRYMMRWFFDPAKICRYTTGGLKSRMAQAEFAKLCSQCGVTEELCRGFFIEKEQARESIGY